MAYSELIKSFERIRNYMREFYVYGFKSLEEYSIKSARSYDNERRRIESWIGDFTVELLDSQTCRFSADVYDASEMLPWLRTFIGRIVDLKCSSQYVLDMFREDLARMDALYGGGDDVIQ